MTKHLKLLVSLAFAAFLIISGCTKTSMNESKKEQEVKNENLILATTTSTQDSGLLDYLLPMFEKETGYKVKPIAVGTGEALELGKKGEADVLLVHAPDAEQELVDSGDVTNRQRVMYNDFIVIGPKNDPAGIKGLEVKHAFQKLAAQKAVFVSRGDDSGTHKKELVVWKSISTTPTPNESYLETGQGMGATLQVAVEKSAYTLTDRATFLAQEKNLHSMTVLVEGHKDLLNIYHVMQVDPEKHEKINEEGAKAFVEFLIKDKTQAAIEEFGKKEYGQSLFFKYTEE